MPAQMDCSPGGALRSGVTELGLGPSGGQGRIGVARDVIHCGGDIGRRLRSPGGERPGGAAGWKLADLFRLGLLTGEEFLDLADVGGEQLERHQQTLSRDSRILRRSGSSTASRAPSLIKPFMPSFELRKVAYMACHSGDSWGSSWVDDPHLWASALYDELKRLGYPLSSRASPARCGWQVFGCTVRRARGSKDATLFPGQRPSPDFDVKVVFHDASAVVHTRSSSRCAPDPLVADLLPSRLPPRLLTGMTLRRFGISACSANPEGLPPSLAQHGSCWRSSTSSPLPFQDPQPPSNPGRIKPPLSVCKALRWSPRRWLNTTGVPPLIFSGNVTTRPTPADEIDYRSLLEEERSLLQRKLSADGGGVTTGGQGTPDSSKVASWRGEAKSPTVQAQEALGEVESALQRLDDGIYGRCEGCGDLVAPERLEALPAARFCVTCA